MLKNFKPENVFRIFEEICNIPHPSGHTKEISDYCVNFAKKLGLKFIQDEFGNVIIFKDATPGYENSKTVIVQGHIDMVPDKTAESKHVFEKDPLELVIEGDYVTANGTTLGGDDGSGAAFALALLEEDTPHPALEVLLTVDEEIGMLGATKADFSMLKGEILINIDSEVEGEFTVGCAGGVRTECIIPISFDESFVGDYYTLTVSGLKGGHSGIEIDKQRANANNVLGMILNELSKEADIRLIYAKGGKMDNAICAKSESIIMIKPEDASKAEKIVKDLDKEFKLEYNKADPQISLCLQKAASLADAIGKMDNKPSYELKTTSKDSNARIIKYLKLAPWGVQAMEQSDSKSVETSLNLGQIWTEENNIHFGYLTRSSNSVKKGRIVDILETLTIDAGGYINNSGEYPSWTYLPDNELAPIMTSIYKEITGKEPVVNVIHAGLECGIIISKTNVKSAVSYGPNILDIHTPNEKLDIPSVGRMYELLKKTLSKIK